MRGGRIGSRVGNQQEGKERRYTWGSGIFHLKKKNWGHWLLSCMRRIPPFFCSPHAPSSFTLSNLLPRSSSSLITIAAAELCMCEHACVCAYVCVRAWAGGRVGQCDLGRGSRQWWDVCNLNRGAESRAG